MSRFLTGGDLRSWRTPALLRRVAVLRQGAL